MRSQDHQFGSLILETSQELYHPSIILNIFIKLPTESKHC